jgi:hypothetical protein
MSGDRTLGESPENVTFCSSKPPRQPAWTTPTHGPSPLLPTLACTRRLCAICFSGSTLGSPDRSPGGPSYRGTSGTSAVLLSCSIRNILAPGRLLIVGHSGHSAPASFIDWHLRLRPALLSCHVCNVVPQACRFRAGFVPDVWVLGWALPRRMGFFAATDTNLSAIPDAIGAPRTERTAVEFNPAHACARAIRARL